MRKLLPFIFLLLGTLSYSQVSPYGGTLVNGLVPIERTNTSSSLNSDATISTADFLVTPPTPTGSSPEIGITGGQLDVSLSGGATYNIPIVTPVGVRGVVPKINLSYNSQAGNGIAGYGWEISGVSAITRIPSTKHHDGSKDAVDFDGLDRFSLDGQRLIVKSGTSGVYGAHLTVYETEDFSNVRVTSYGVSPYGAAYGPLYFMVEYPDGSTAKYGGSTAFNSQMDWAIEYWQDPQGNKITYNYESSSNNLLIKSISYGVNKIEFVYLARTRSEDAYVGGIKFTNDKILKEINIKVNSIGFRNYFLDYNTTTLGYQRLLKITEKSGDNTKSLNPTVFSYDTTTNDVTFAPITTNLNIGNITQINTASVSGDFDGDGHMDFLLYPLIGSFAKQNFSIFTGIDGESSSTNLGYEVPTGAFEELFPSTWLSEGNTIVPYQGITVVQKVNDVTTNFKNYYLAPYGVYLENQKQVTFPANTHQKKYVSGDFNGDGLSDVMAFDYSETGAFTEKTAYFIDLDRRKTTNFMNIAGNLIGQVYGSILVTGDVNGDGKTDLLQFRPGTLRVFSLNDSNQFVQIMEPYYDANISVESNQNILIGDYNGDGKTDFIMTKAYNSNNFAKFTSTGTTFVKLDAVYDIYFLGDSIGSCVRANRIIPSDINGDGKTDLIDFSSCVDNSNGDGTYNLRVYNNTGSNFTSNYNCNSGVISGLVNYPVPVCLSANKPNVNLEFAVISNSTIHRFEAHKNSSKETLLRSITTGNGVTESITYAPLVTSNDYFPLYTGDYNDVYPNADIIYSPSFQVVSKIEKQSADTYKKQLFAYYGAVSNMEGLGFLGFKSTMRTNWHNDTSQVISNVSKFDVNLRGAQTDSFSILSYYNPFNNPTPSNFISRTVSSYNTYDNVIFDPALLANKVFKIKNTLSKQYNGLDNTSSETITIYDVYNHPTQVTTVLKNGTAVEQTAINNFEYDDQSVGPVYYIGRPHRKTTSTSIPQNNDTTTSEEIFNYNTSQLLETVQKKGHLTEFITETNVYGTFGNLTKKTISAPGITSRFTSFEYDTTGRFVTKSFDVEGLETKFENDPNTGFLTKVTDPYKHVVEYKYDAWGKKNEEKIDLNTITIVYTKPEAATTLITKTGTDGTSMIAKYDDQGREIISGIKNVDATWSYIKTTYDDFDRKISVGEPVSTLTATPTQFTTITFDKYGRPLTTIEPTGKTTTVTYSPLKTSVYNGVKTVETIKNAIGNPVSVTDEGGTITYTYFASGNLKNSVYDGLTTSFTYNGWGKKLSLDDPSAGMYAYAYNAFGEITDEINPDPKGKTHYDYDDFGKLLKKTLTSLDNMTSSETTYTYITGLIKQSSFKNILENNSIILNEYTYADPTYTDRITKTVETTPYATFTKDATYDSYGRMLTETSTAKVNANAKTSSKKVRYTYKNGAHWQILDDATSAILWQTNTVNARGQLTGGLLGGITVTNTYDNYGFPTQFKHDNGAANIMTLNTVFNAQKGNLTSRTNNLISRDETFEYDTQDRLIKNTYPEIINNSTFTTTAEGFTVVNGATAAVSFTRLSVKATAAQAGVQKLITTNVPQGTLLTISAIVTKKGIDKIRAVIVEENISSGTTTQIVLGTITADMTFQAQHQVSNSNLNVYLRFDKSELSSDVGTSKDFILDNVIVSKNTTEIQEYDNAGRITANKLGSYGYDAVKKYQNNAIALSTEANAYYSAKPTQTVSYNLFKCPVQITEDNVDKISFTYNDNNARSSMFYGGLQAIKTDRPIRKDYSADGTMEIKHTATSDEFIIYIGGNGYTAPVVLKKDDVTQDYLYLHRDYQGTILAISKAGAVIEKRLFDPWGAIITVQNGAGVVQPGLMVLDRGYTGHEHLQTVGLINMNARLYDPKLHRFLQPDNFIQDPSNTQNYNRYAYVLNNPLKYTDPTGNLFGDGFIEGGAGLGLGLALGGPLGWAIGGGIMAASILANNWDNWGIKNWSNKNIDIGEWSNWASNNLKSINGWFDNNLRSFGDWISGKQDVKYLDYQVGSISFSPNFGYGSSFASTISSGNNGSYGNVEVHAYAGDTFSGATDGFDFQKLANYMSFKGGAVGTSASLIESMAKNNIIANYKQGGNVLDAMKDFKDVSKLGKLAKRIGYAGLAINAVEVGTGFANGTNENSDYVRLGINTALTIITISNPVGIIALGAYSAFDYYYGDEFWQSTGINGTKP